MSAAVALATTVAAAAAAGLFTGSAGNASVRLSRGRFLITPTGSTPATIAAETLVEVDLEGRAYGPLKPSSEWRFHRDIYRARREARAVVHCHSPYATALACLRRDIPPFHYMVARFGGDSVRCARYATFGTAALSRAVLEALSERSACLLANHGMVVFGPSPEAALAHAIELEELCAQYLHACQLGEPVLLTAREMERVKLRFAGYGQKQPARRSRA